MIDFDHVSVTFDGTHRPVLTDVRVRVPEGEFCLVAGPTGAGKSTLLGLVNGHVPHFTGGTVAGAVRVDGRDTRDWRPRDLADVVGVVGQDPARGFVTDRVADELAYTMESLALSGPVMRRRVEDTLDLLGLVDLRDRPLASLSGGQQQRVAIGAALTAHPRVLVLDEPTSALDPAAAEEVLATLHRLVHDLGVTVLLAEHRLERVIGDVDSVVLVGDSVVRHGSPADMMAISPVRPPVVELADWAGWSPLPLTVREARRQAGPLRAQLDAHLSHAHLAQPDHEPPRPDLDVQLPLQLEVRPRPEPPDGIQVRRLTAGYGRRDPVLGPVDLSAGPAEIIAVTGRNGAGKSTLLWTLAGAAAPVQGSVVIHGLQPRTLPPARRRRLVALVPQQPADLLFRTTVAAELGQADLDALAPAGTAAAGTAAALLDEIAPGIDRRRHPRDLSEGQRLALVVAIQSAADPAVLLLDEPTRGLDYQAKERLTRLLRRLAAGGTSILLASHDVEFVAGSCDRVVILADGRIVDDGPTAEVVTASPTYAPQVAKVLAPARMLTVAQVQAILTTRSAAG